MTRNTFTAALVALVVLVGALTLSTADAQQCPPGVQCVGEQCVRRSIDGSVGTFGRAIAWPNGAVSLRGGLGGATMRLGMEPVVRTSCVLPVFFGTDPTPGAGTYVGIIEGRGVTLSCWHAAKHGIHSVGPERPIGVTRDKYGYDMVAILTRPLGVPVAILGPEASRGDAVSIIGYPSGRYGQHSGRVDCYAIKEDDQPWPDLIIGVGSRDGDSGGAVLNSDGQLVGLLWGTATDGSQSSVAVSVPAIADFLRRIQIMLAGEPAERVRVPYDPDDYWPKPMPGPSDGIDSAGNPVEDTPPIDLSDILVRIANIVTAIEAMEPQPGPQGARGPTDPPGIPGGKGDTGDTGADGQPFDIASLTDEQILALVLRLPPMRLQIVKADPTTTTSAVERIRNAKPGDVIQEISGRLGGEPLKLRLHPVQSGGK